ncbi:MAG: hypothetical protein IH859_05290 [Chloroflexi bacterium]|nr:hypothetical protein [Chloroflexota bacterium]
MTAVAQPGEIHYPNHIGYLILTGIKEILGEENIDAILQIAQIKSSIENYQDNILELQFSAAQLSSILNALEIHYNQPAGRGLALRAGRACFKIMLREFGLDLGLAKPDFRLLPLRKKLPAAAAIFADAINYFSEEHIHFEETDDAILWHVSRCPLCWNRQSESPACHFGVGMLQASLYWLSGGKDYFIEETECIAAGAERCTFQILKQPVH